MMKALTYITHAAVKYNDRVYSLPRPWRHHHVLRLIGGVYGQCTQGFLTNHGEFVNRNKAMKIAIDANQVDPDKFIKEELYTEYVWPENNIEQYTTLSIQSHDETVHGLTKAVFIPTQYALIVHEILNEHCDNEVEVEIKSRTLFSILNYLAYLNRIWPQDTAMYFADLRLEQSYSLVS